MCCSGGGFGLTDLAMTIVGAACMKNRTESDALTRQRVEQDSDEGWATSVPMRGVHACTSNPVLLQIVTVLGGAHKSLPLVELLPRG